MRKKQHEKGKIKLIYSMSGMIILCWLIPLLLFTYLLLFLVTGKMNAQIEKTIITSADKAIEICEMQLDDLVTASRNASYIPTIQDSYAEYCRTQSEQDLYLDVTLFLTQQYKYNKNLLCTMLFFLDNPEEIYYTYGSSNSTAYMGVRDFQDQYQQSILDIAAGNETGVQFFCVDGRAFMMRNLVDSSFKSYAVLVMELNLESIFKGLDSVWGSVGYQVHINGDGLVTMGDYHDAPAVTYPGKDDRVSLNSKYIHENKNAFVYKVIKMTNNTLNFSIRLDSQAILDELQITRIMLILLLVFMIPLILIIFLFLYRKVSGPMGRIMAGAQEIKQGNYGHQITDSGNSLEFASLEKSFNTMSLELKHQFEQIYVEELELKDAQIMALQSQINPHFLNNTLEIINWECRLSGNNKASSMIEALSVMLNATMNRRKQNMISLTEELSYVDAYLLIIQQRFGSRFQVKKNIDHTILWVEVPRLIIQPIIENAVEHGMDYKNRGSVTLDIYAVEDKVHIDVTNNGVMTEEDRRKVRELLSSDFKEEGAKATNLGIRNVNRRLKIIYGDECGLTISSNEEGYTVSTIIIDMYYGKGDEDEEDNSNINE